MRNIRIALCQCGSDAGSVDTDPRARNFERLSDWVGRAAEQQADIAVFGELYLTGYRTGAAMHRYVLSPTDDDPWVARMTELAARHRLWLIVGAASCGNSLLGDMYNSAFLVSPQGLAGIYSKTHVATFVVDDETLADEGCFYSPGPEIEVFDTPFGRLGIQICYDIHFPEMSRVLTLKGAEVIINVAAAVAGFERFWDVLLPVRAEENHAWYVMSSVVGEQKDARFFGGSRVVNPTGEEAVRGPNYAERLVLADLDASLLRSVRLRSHRFAARRPELYSVITDPKAKF